MDAFTKLGRQLDERWRAAGHRASAFGSLACGALTELLADSPASGDDIARWAVASDSLPRQANQPISFGQPPITVYRGDGFYIEALYWLDGTTAIHDHAFAGAFAVLEGSSLHTTFAFDQSEFIDARIRLGSLSRENSELLAAGDVREIVAGRSFIHSLFHLDRPSVSLTVRTYADAQAYPQLEYRRPGLAMDSSFSPEAPARKLAVLDMLANTASQSFEPALHDYLRRADLLHCFRALEQTTVHASAHVHVAGGFEVVGERFAEHVPVLRGALAETVRQRNIHSRRERVHEPEQRFLLALLLNVTDRGELLNIVRERTGAEDPVEPLMQWMAALAKGGREAIGIDLDQAGLATLEGMVRGCSEDEICERYQVPRMNVAKWGMTLPRTQLLGSLLH